MSQSTFDHFGLPAKLLQALARNKFTTPTPIQSETIPVARQGKDVLGSAQTGTGKTGAFGIPVIAGLMENPEAAALIMTPTRELAGQVIKALEPMIPTVDIRTALLIGGEAMPKQMSQLRHNPRLIVGTPGRINDHLERGSLKLGNVRFLVLDETDRMLDMGFGIQIERILKHVSEDRQTLLFSATLPHNITKLSSKYMRDPVRIAVGSTTEAHVKIKQEVIPVNDHEKYGKLVEQLNTRKGSVIIFVKTKFGTEKLAKRLSADNHRADAIHGDLQQRRRERVIQNFRDSKYRVLVATDVAARGLDIPHIAHVINYDMPQAPEDYIHRIGRTARAGAEGEAVSFLTGADTAKWRAIQRLMGGDTSPEPARSGRGGARGFGGKKPFWKKDGPRGERKFGDKPYGDRAQTGRSFGDKQKSDRPLGDRPRGERSFGHPARREDPRAERGDETRAHTPHPRREQSERKGAEKTEWSPSDRVRTDRPFSERPTYSRHKSDRLKGKRSEQPYGEKPRGEGETGQRPNRFHSDKPRSDKPRGDKPFGDRSKSDRPHSAGKPNTDRAQGHSRSAGKPAEGKSFGGRKFGGDKKFGGSTHSGGKPFGRKPPKG